MKKFPRLAVDAVVLDGDCIVLIKRRNPPFRGMWALPGGFVEYGETVEDAVKREVREETGLDAEVWKLVGVYSDPCRDPRGHIISICFLCRSVAGTLKADTDSVDVRKFKLSKIPELAFDHKKILGDLSL
jgi:8-oxo-dGTP diphosphatase